MFAIHFSSEISANFPSKLPNRLGFDGIEWNRCRYLNLLRNEQTTEKFEENEAIMLKSLLA